VGKGENSEKKKVVMVVGTPKNTRITCRKGKENLYK